MSFVDNRVVFSLRVLGVALAAAVASGCTAHEQSFEDTASAQRTDPAAVRRWREFPGLVGIHALSTEGYGWVCGGVQIARNPPTILTAAHCVTEPLRTQPTVRRFVIHNAIGTPLSLPTNPSGTDRVEVFVHPAAQRILDENEKGLRLDDFRGVFGRAQIQEGDIDESDLAVIRLVGPSASRFDLCCGIAELGWQSAPHLVTAAGFPWPDDLRLTEPATRAGREINQGHFFAKLKTKGTGIASGSNFKDELGRAEFQLAYANDALRFIPASNPSSFSSELMLNDGFSPGYSGGPVYDLNMSAGSLGRVGAIVSGNLSYVLPPAGERALSAAESSGQFVPDEWNGATWVDSVPIANSTSDVRADDDWAENKSADKATLTLNGKSIDVIRHIHDDATLHTYGRVARIWNGNPLALGGGYFPTCEWLTWVKTAPTGSTFPARLTQSAPKCDYLP